DLAKGAGGGGGHFRTDGGSEIDAVDPVEGLENKGHGGGAAAAENHGTHPDAVRVFPVLVNDGAVPCRGGEAAVGVAGRDRFAVGVLLSGGPIAALPVDEMGRRLGGHALPPHIPVVGEGNV